MAASGPGTWPQSGDNGGANRRTPCRTSSSLGLECHVSYTYKPNDPLWVCCPPSPLAGCFSRQWSRVPGVALPVSPSRITGLPAVSTCIVSLALGLPHPREPSVSSLALQKPYPSPSSRDGPTRTTTPDARGEPGSSFVRRGIPTPSVVSGSLCGLAVETRSGVISQASPILPNPFCFYFNPTHYS